MTTHSLYISHTATLATQLMRVRKFRRASMKKTSLCYCQWSFRSVVMQTVSRLGGVIVTVLAIRHKVRGFKLGWSDGFLMDIESRSTPSFGGKVKPKVPYRKILRHVHRRAKFISSPALPAFYRMILLVGLPESSGGRIRSFPLSTSFHHCFPCSYHLSDEQ
jgi:hypothetical protein